MNTSTRLLIVSITLNLILVACSGAVYSGIQSGHIRYQAAWGTSPITTALSMTDQEAEKMATVASMPVPARKPPVPKG